jgi:hypothetical protein
MTEKTNKYEWQDEADVKAAEAAKTVPTAGTAKDVAEWFAKNRAATYKRLVQVMYGAFGLK